MNNSFQVIFHGQTTEFLGREDPQAELSAQVPLRHLLTADRGEWLLHPLPFPATAAANSAVAPATAASAAIAVASATPATTTAATVVAGAATTAGAAAAVVGGGAAVQVSDVDVY